MYNKNSTSPGNFQGVKLNMAESDGVQGHVIKSLPTFVKKPLNLISKQIEEKKQKNRWFWCGFRLKKLMVLIGTSIHCICLMICIQGKNQWQWQWQFGRNCHLQKLIGRLLLKFKEGLLLSPLRTRGFRGGVVMKI